MDGPTRDEPPVGWRELLAVVLVVVLADVTVYRGHGYAGYAALFARGSLALAVGDAAGANALQWSSLGQCGIVGIMLAVLAARMLWCGWALNNVGGAGPADGLRTGPVGCSCPTCWRSSFSRPTWCWVDCSVWPSTHACCGGRAAGGTAWRD